MGTKIFNLETLSLKFDLLSKNVNLDHSFLTIRERIFVFYMHIPRDNTFPWVSNFLTFNVDLLLKITLTFAIAY